MKDGKFITLAIESSCDETSIAVVADGRELWSNVIASQIKVHEVFGGVVPEIASRHHLENINKVLESALKEANVTIKEVDLIGVTQGPGLVGALLIGIATAKALAYAHQIPLVGVNHIHGHISANYIEHKDLEPPFLGLIVSGGHTTIANIKGYNELEVIGRTRDDAVGEAFDKVARVLGLGYPGGPLIDKIAVNGNPKAVLFKRVLLEKESLDFSFSGTKTGVLNYLNTLKLKGEEVNVADVAASFQQSVMEVIVTKIMVAAEITKADKVVLAGGVAANSQLRKMMKDTCDKRGIRLYHPSPILCTDNGGMIGAAAYYKYKKDMKSDLHMDAYPNLSII